MGWWGNDNRFGPRSASAYPGWGFKAAVVFLLAAILVTLVVGPDVVRASLVEFWRANGPAMIALRVGAGIGALACAFIIFSLAYALVMFFVHRMWNEWDNALMFLVFMLALIAFTTGLSVFAYTASVDSALGSAKAVLNSMR